MITSLIAKNISMNTKKLQQSKPYHSCKNSIFVTDKPFLTILLHKLIIHNMYKNKSQLFYPLLNFIQQQILFMGNTPEKSPQQIQLQQIKSQYFSDNKKNKSFDYREQQTSKTYAKYIGKDNSSSKLNVIYENDEISSVMSSIDYKLQTTLTFDTQQIQSSPKVKGLVDESPFSTSKNLAVSRCGALTPKQLRFHLSKAKVEIK